MEERPETKNRIGILSSIFWVIIGGIFDVLTFIPFVGDFIGWFFWLIFSLYLWKIGMGLINGKRLATAITSTVIEMIPAAQFLPSIVVGVIVVIILTKIEDKTGISLTNPIKKGVTPPRAMRIPKNSNGVRKPTNYTAEDEDFTLAA